MGRSDAEPPPGAQPVLHLIRRGGRCLVLHVPQGRVLEIDCELVQAVEALAGGLDPMQAIEQLPDLQLRKRAARVLGVLTGLGFEEHAQAPPAEVDGRFDTLDLHISHDCNLSCRYCYAAGGSFGGKRRLMSLETAFRAVDLFFDNVAEDGLLNLCFDGGEPMLAFERMKGITEHARSRAKKLGRILALSIGTNATVLNDEMAAFLGSYHLGTQVSLDGAREAHDALRPFRSGRGSFDSVVRGIRQMQDHGVHVAGRITLTPWNLELLETVELMHGLGLIRIAAFPATAIHGETAVRSEHVQRIREELDKVAELFLRVHIDEGRRLYFSNLDDRVRDIHLAKRRLWSCGAGRKILSVDPDGALFPCHRLVGNPRFRMGHVADGIDRQVQRRFFRNTVLSHDRCRQCWARYLCGGGCAVDAEFAGSGMDEPYEPMCELTRHEIELAAWLYAEMRARAPEMLKKICTTYASTDMAGDMTSAIESSRDSVVPVIPPGRLAGMHEGGL